MVVYYINSRGEKLDLMKKPYGVVETDWYDSDWEESTQGYEKTVKIDVFGKREEFIDNMERLYNVLGYDAENGMFGRLYVNGAFLRCKIERTKKSNWKGYVYSVVELIFYAPKLEWITEKILEFYPSKQSEMSEGLNFPFNFPFNFAASLKGYKTVTIDNITANDFQFVIYGPCINPRVVINGYPYEMFCTLESNEYLVIDSVAHTIYKYTSNGQRSNLWNERGLEHSVFEKIPSGTLNINWSGEFGFDIMLFLKRREAKW